MAVIKDLPSSYGIDLSYHRVLFASINSIEKEVIICVGSYFNKEARDKGCDTVDQVDIQVPSEDYNLFLKGNIYEASYNWLKANVEGFEDGVDG